MGALDKLIQLSFATLLSKKFVNWDAYKFGLIDKKGNKIRDAETKEEKKSLDSIKNLVRKVKRIMVKFMPDTPTINFLIANMMLRESENEFREEIEKDLNYIEMRYLNMFLDNYEKKI